MNKICMGCGSVLQTKSKENQGYVPELKYEDSLYCERCFRLKHYREMRMDALTMSNDEILDRANGFSGVVYYLVDLLNLGEESMKWYQRIRGKKMLILTKVDYIPRSISLDQLCERIRTVYQVEEKIIPVSVRSVSMVAHVWNLMKMQKSVLFLGMTNVGKSSFLNQLYQYRLHQESPILASVMPNTTQEFIPMRIDDVLIYDAPGFGYEHVFFKDKKNLAVPKKYIRPITQPMKEETRILIDQQFSLKQDKRQNHVTFYGSNAMDVEKVYRDCLDFSYEKTVLVNSGEDLVFPGVGFFRFRESANVTIQSLKEIDFEVRTSLIGGRK